MLDGIGVGVVRGLLAAGLVLVPAAGGEVTETGEQAVEPFRRIDEQPAAGGMRVELRDGAFQALADGPARVRVSVPVTPSMALPLDLDRFEVLGPSARFVHVVEGREVVVPAPQVLAFRGQVAGQAASRAFIALTPRGTGRGEIVLDDGRHFILGAGSGERGTGIVVHELTGPPAAPDLDTICATAGPAAGPPEASDPPAPPAPLAPLVGGPRIAKVAVDADGVYVDMFDGDVQDAGAYVVMLIAAVSDIYTRDLETRLRLDFVRLWSEGGDEPFSADDLGSFAGFWNTTQEPEFYNLIHLLTGRRDMGYGGVAFVSGPCGGAYGISGYLLGGFPSPVEGTSLGFWDPVVVAHEMGHNMGTFHTHDGYEPPIDECGSAGVHTRGTIMSYCHTTAGGLLNIEMRFHARVQDVIDAVATDGSCLALDCNGNLIEDDQDLLLGTSLDANGNGVPDECEDCDGNGVLDDEDLAAGAPDVNGNGVLDACEADCNGNGIPDEHEIALGEASDENGNRVPDTCDSDCDGDGVADFAEIAAGIESDLDRNGIPDACQDCDGNGRIDAIDLERQHFIYVADRSGIVREYHGASGVAARNLAVGEADDPHGAVFGPDRHLYVSNHGDDRILRIEIETGSVETFVASGAGGLDGPTAIVFASDGTLLVASLHTDSVLAYDAGGAPLGAFVDAGAGGLIGPYGLAFDASGDLLVSGADNAVREYSGSDGSFVGVFVAPGAGGLSAPRDLAFTTDGRLLVASFGNDQVIAYGATGDALGPFTVGPAPTGAWGLRIGPNGNVFVTRNLGTIRVVEYDVETGWYVRSFIRAERGLVSPTSFDFRPASGFDCDGNTIPDVCDLGSGGALDCDGDQIIDACAIAADPALDADGNGLLDTCQQAGDNNGDGLVDVADLLALLGAWGPCPACPEDTNGDGAVNVDDLLNLLAGWG